MYENKNFGMINSRIVWMRLQVFKNLNMQIFQVKINKPQNS